MKQKKIGILYLLCFVLFEATDILIVKKTFLMDAAEYALISQVLFTALCLIGLYILFRTKSKKLQMKKKDIPKMVGIGVL